MLMMHHNLKHVITSNLTLNTCYAQYVDDTTVISVSEDAEDHL